MKPVNNNVVVNVKAGAIGKTTVSGKLNLNSTVQNGCEAVLRLYEAGKVKQASQDLNKLLKSHPNSLIVKRLNVLILYKERKYAEAYEKVKKILEIVPNNSSSLNMQGLLQRQLSLFICF